ncbi:MAG: TolC family protein [Opitutaceae bacterium]|nr:TolC family protein [Opitutaceae bacterium]
MVSLGGAALLLAAGGCATSPAPIAERWVEARPLGRELATFRPPRETAAASPAPAIEEPGAMLGLRQALALALARNPELAAFSWDVRIGEARMLQAGLRPNPEVGLGVENILGTGDFRAAREAQTTLQLSQLVELGGKRVERMKEAELARDLAGWDYETRRIEVLARTAEAFVEVLTLQRHLELADESVRLAENVARTVAERVAAAKTFVVEKTKADVALASAQLERDQTQRALSAARQRLASNWGTTQAGFERVEGNLENLEPIPPQEQLLARLAQNPELARWATELLQREAALRVEKSRATPDLSIVGGYRRLPDLAGASGPNNDSLLVGVSIPWPLHHRNQGAIREAGYRVAKATEEQRAAELRVKTELAQAWQQLAAAAAEVEALKTKILPGAQETFQTLSQYYRDGRLSYLEVLDAQRTYFGAQEQYFRALRGYHTAVIAIERLIGERLSPDANQP